MGLYKAFRFFFLSNQIVTTEKEAYFKCNKAVKTMRLYIEFLNHHIQSDPGPFFQIIFVNNFLGSKTGDML